MCGARRPGLRWGRGRDGVQFEHRRTPVGALGREYAWTLARFQTFDCKPHTDRVPRVARARGLLDRIGDVEGFGHERAQFGLNFVDALREGHGFRS